MVRRFMMAIRGRYDENGKTAQHAELRTDGDKISNALTHVLKDEMILLIRNAYCLMARDCKGFCNQPSNGVLAIKEGEGTLIRKEDLAIRKLTPQECWRLMDFTDEDFKKAQAVNSNTQLYKQAGNAIVTNCLVALFGQMIPGHENDYKELKNWKSF